MNFFNKKYPDMKNGNYYSGEKKTEHKTSILYRQDKYHDILYLKRPRSNKHLPMSVKSRAGQFSSFAALKGHKESVEETAYYYERAIK